VLDAQGVCAIRFEALVRHSPPHSAHHEDTVSRLKGFGTGSDDASDNAVDIVFTNPPRDRFVCEAGEC